MIHDSIVRVVGHVVDVAPKTRWIFITVETASGLSGVGEASLNGHEAAVLEAASGVADRLFDNSLVRVALEPEQADLATAAATAAIDQALWDLAGKREEKSVATILGGAQRDTVPLYANINRRTRDRSPAGFAASAKEACAAGFTAIKIAPFDEVTPGQPATARDLAPGLERIAATRAAIGASDDLMVDCHWRLNEPAAIEVIDAAASLGLYWLECPIPENNEAIPVIKRLRGHANRKGIRLAGLERGIGIAGFAPYLDAGAYDAMMPDAKYVGSLKEMLALAERFAASSVAFSPHNPTGPICHAASLHVCAAAPAPARLEMQFDETELFDKLVDGGLPQPHAGSVTLPMDRPGFGVSLNPAVMQEHEVMRFERRGSAAIPL